MGVGNNREGLIARVRNKKKQTTKGKEKHRGKGGNPQNQTGLRAKTSESGRRGGRTGRMW